MSAPADQLQRDAFINGLDRNFSVVASAGSGKTRAITDRIVAIARSLRAREWLSSLVVVTFTNRAADEMQQRARQRILEEGVPLEVLAAFNRAFFGTIHSFCVKLLRQHGHHLAVPAQPDLLTDDDALWMEFVQQQTTIGATLSEPQRRCLQRLAPVRQLMELGRGAGAASLLEAPGEFPAFDFSEVHGVTAGARERRTSSFRRNGCARGRRRGLEATDSSRCQNAPERRRTLARSGVRLSIRCAAGCAALPCTSPPKSPASIGRFDSRKAC